jgi:RNA polymerase sigma-70 factor (ECF subfamily)
MIDLAGGDAELIAASLEEPERFAALFDRHAPAMHQYVTRRLGRDAADDVTAETF